MFIKFPKMTPERYMLFLLALLIDLSGLILLCFGLDDFGILDGIGIATVGFWMGLKSRKMTIPKTKGGGLRGFLKNLYTGKKSKFLAVFGGEMIPWLGGILWSWVAAVYFQSISEEELEAQKEQGII
jgi:hypothetical protein